MKRFKRRHIQVIVAMAAVLSLGLVAAAPAMALNRIRIYIDNKSSYWLRLTYTSREHGDEPSMPTLIAPRTSASGEQDGNYWGRTEGWAEYTATPNDPGTRLPGQGNHWDWRAKIYLSWYVQPNSGQVRAWAKPIHRNGIPGVELPVTGTISDPCCLGYRMDVTIENPR